MLLLQISAVRVAVDRARTAHCKAWRAQVCLAGKLAAASQQPTTAAHGAVRAGPRPPGLAAEMLRQHQRTALLGVGGEGGLKGGAGDGGGPSATGVVGARRTSVGNAAGLRGAAGAGDRAAERLESELGVRGRDEDLALQEMAHFVANLQQFVVDRLLHGAWAKLQQVCVCVKPQCSQSPPLH